MKLHNDIKFFRQTVLAAETQLQMNLEFIEKDYWITLVLSRLAKTKYASVTVFKGGTSLSKGFGLIDRFSTDVDIAIINNDQKSGNEIKTIIRTVEKKMTEELKELNVDGVTSKGSRFRKFVFKYQSINEKNSNNTLMVEINSFANPFPFSPMTIKSFVCDFLEQSANEKYIEEYELQPFTINVLNKEQTLLEKLVSLIRFSFDANAVESLSKKIRHFYDLYFLMNHADCISLTQSGNLKEQFNAILAHDKEMFDEPTGWQNRLITESPLINNFDHTWIQLKEIYRTELSALAYTPIPDETKIALQFKNLVKMIQ